jgi:hypothetical protein
MRESYVLSVTMWGVSHVRIRGFREHKLTFYVNVAAEYHNHNRSAVTEQVCKNVWPFDV